jgi:hypothetical protein
MRGSARIVEESRLKIYPIPTPRLTFGYTRAGDTRTRGSFLPGKGYEMDKYRQEQVISALKEKGAILPCPRCRNLEFEVIGEGTIAISPDKNVPLASVFQPMNLNPEVPVILVSCNRCGYIAQHARALIGLVR